MAHAEEREGLLSYSICCIVVRHHHHHWPHHQKAPSLPPALTTTRCYPPSVSFPIVVFEKTFLSPPHVPRHYSPRFPPSASLRSTLRPISLRHSWSTLVHLLRSRRRRRDLWQATFCGVREANCDWDDFLCPEGGWGGNRLEQLLTDAVWRICSRMGKRIGLLAHGNNNISDNISELFFILFVVCIISMFYSFVLD